MTQTYLAFDCYAYPGDAAIAALQALGFSIAGLYLSHNATGSDPDWIAAAATLSANGWGLIPLYLGAQTVDVHGHPVAPPADPAAAAATDAAHALALAAQANLPANTTLFFDIEDGTTPAGAYETYLLAWAAAITAAGYTPAFYCSHLVAPWAQAKGFAVWSFHLYQSGGAPLDPAALPADPVDPNCLGTQTRQGVTITGLTGANTKPLTIDYSVFTIPNPAASTATS